MQSNPGLTQQLSAPDQPVFAQQDSVAAAAERPLRVAIVDDELSVRTAIGRLIGAWDMTVGSFSNCMELFNALPMFAPDCIILDLYMPGMDGLEVLTYLRKIRVTAPVIMITAQDDPTLRDTCLEAGATAFLRKPLQAAELLTTIALVTKSGA